ncbi:hypothetical protein D3C78_1351990 [compost metagenome]
MGIEELAGLGQRQRPRAAHQQGHPQLLFQLLYLPTQRRLRDMQAFGGAGDVPLLRDHHKIAQMAQIHLHTSKV